MNSALGRIWVGTVGTSALTLAIGICTGVLTARLLGPDGRGLLAVLVFWPSLFASVGYLSLGASVVYRTNHRKIERKRFISSVAITSLILVVPTVAGGLLLIGPLLSPGRAEAIPLAALYMAAFVPFNFIAIALLAVDKAEQRFFRYNLLRLMPSGIILVGLLVLWISGKVSLSTALLAIWLGTSVTAVVRLSLWRNELLVRPSVREIKSLLHQGMLFHGATILSTLSAQADRMVVMWFFGDTEVGIYVVASIVATAGLSLVTTSVHTVLFPRLAAQPSRDKSLLELRVGLRRSTLFLLFGSAVGIALIPSALPILFGPSFVDSVPIAILLVLAFVPLALRQIMIHCLRAFGNARSGVIAEGMASASFVLFAIPAMHLIGLAGVPAALIIANVIAMAILATQLRNQYGITIRSWLVPSREMIEDAISTIIRLFPWRLAVK